MRVRVLEIANERPISPAQFVDGAIHPTPIGDARKKALSHVSYHFRELARAGCIEVVDVIPRRGSVEHVYRGTIRAYFSDDEWEGTAQELRRKISATVLQGLIANVEGAMLANTFDARDDRWLTWTRANLDERGWAEMTTTLAANFAEMERVRTESEARLAESGGEAIPVTFGLLGFESPPTPAAG